MQKSFVDNIMIQPEQIKYSNHPTGTIQGYYDYIDSFGNKKRISRYGKTKALVFNRFLNDFIVCDDKYNIVCSQKPKFYVQNEPKTFSSKRIVPLLPEAKEYLLKYKEQFYKSEDTFIIHSNNGNGLEPLTQSSFQHRFYVFKKAANVNTSASLHALRHTFATRLYRENIPLKYISAALGHSSTKITSDAYVNIYNMENYDNAFKNIYGINGL